MVLHTHLFHLLAVAISFGGWRIPRRRRQKSADFSALTTSAAVCSTSESRPSILSISLNFRQRNMNRLWGWTRFADLLDTVHGGSKFGRKKRPGGTDGRKLRRQCFYFYHLFFPHWLPLPEWKKTSIEEEKMCVDVYTGRVESAMSRIHVSDCLLRGLWLVRYEYCEKEWVQVIVP